MRPVEILLMYLVMGLATAAGYRQLRGTAPAAVVLVWPLYLPSLLTAPGERFDTAPRDPASLSAIARLRSALELLEGRAQPSLEGIEQGLAALQARRRSLRDVLAQPENDVAALRRLTVTGAAADAHAQRMDNLQRLVRLEQDVGEQHDAVVARVEELATRVQLAHYQGATVAGLDGQLGDLLAAVDGACEVQSL